jgi:hypothetical protein
MKRIIREDFRVVVGPITPYGQLTDDQIAASMERQCRELQQQIERHVDGLGGVSVQWTTRAECSHCGFEWTELTEQDIRETPELIDGDPRDGVGLPFCCEQAQAEWRAAQTAVTA